MVGWARFGVAEEDEVNDNEGMRNGAAFAEHGDGGGNL